MAVRVITGTVVKSGTRPKTVGVTFEKGKVKTIRSFRTKSGAQKAYVDLSRSEKKQASQVIAQNIVNQAGIKLAQDKVNARNAIANKILDDLQRSRDAEVARQRMLQTLRSTNLSGQFINRQLELLNVQKEKARFLRAPVTDEFKSSFDTRWINNYRGSDIRQQESGFGTVVVGGVVFAPTSSRERQYLKLLNKRLKREAKIQQAWQDSINRNRFLTKKGNRWYIRAGQGVVTAGLGLVFSPAFVFNALDKFVVGVAAGLTSPQLRARAKRETVKAIKAVPRTVWESYNPRKPENWGNILAAAASTMIVAGSLKARTSKSKVNKSKSDLKKVTKKVEQAKAAASKSKSPLAKPFLKKVNSSLLRLKKALKKVDRLEKSKGLTPKEAARQSLKLRKAQTKAEGKAALKAAKKRGQVVKKFEKATTAKKIKKAVKKFEKKQVKVRKAERAKAESAFRREIKFQEDLAQNYFDYLIYDKMIPIRSSPKKVVIKAVKKSGVKKNIVINKPVPVPRNGGGKAVKVVTSSRQQLVLQELPVTIPKAVAVRTKTISELGNTFTALAVLGKLSTGIAKSKALVKFNSSLRTASRFKHIDLFDKGVISSSLRVPKSKVKSLSRVKSKSKTISREKSSVRGRQSVSVKAAQDLRISVRQLQRLETVLRKARKRVPKRIIKLLRRKKKRSRREWVLVRDWLKSVPRAYRPSLIAIFLDITDEKIPDDITGLAIRPILKRSKKTSKKKPGKSSSKKKKASKRRKK